MPNSIENRLTWAHSNIDRNWSDIDFSDETSFWAWSPIKHAWSIHGNPVIQKTVKHPFKVHVQGCFNTCGFGTLCSFYRQFKRPKNDKIIPERTININLVINGFLKKTTVQNTGAASVPNGRRETTSQFCLGPLSPLMQIRPKLFVLL